MTLSNFEAIKRLDEIAERVGRARLDGVSEHDVREAVENALWNADQHGVVGREEVEA